MLLRITALGCAFVAGLGAQPSAVELLEQKTMAKIQRYADSFEGVLGVAAIDLTTGRAFSLKGDTVFPTASSIKIPIMIQVFRAARAGQLNLDAKITLGKSDLVEGGRIPRDLAKGPVTLSVRELMAAMIEFSDNTATNALIKMVSKESVNRTLDELGLRQTRLRRIMLDSAAARRDEENVSTPLELAHLVEMLYRKKFPDSLEMLEILKTVDADFRRAIPEEIPVAAKPGSLPGVRCESGLVLRPGRPFALSVMSTFSSDKRNPVHDIAQIVFEYFDLLARSNIYGNRLQ